MQAVADAIVWLCWHMDEDETGAWRQAETYIGARGSVWRIVQL